MTWVARSEREHRAEQRISASQVARIARSPGALRWDLDHPREPTPAMRLGTAIHCAVLQPQEWDARYIVRPEGLDGRTKEGKAWAAECGDRVIVSADDYSTISAVADSVHSHPMVAEWLAHHRTRIEQSVEWDLALDDGTTYPLKGRLDAWAAGAFVVDIKTAADITPRGVERSAWDYGYYIQIALYADAARDADGLDRQPPAVICAVETSPPYGVEVYELAPEYLDQGLREARRLLAIWRECERTGVYPRDSRGERTFLTLYPPRWAKEGR